MPTLFYLILITFILSHNILSYNIIIKAWYSVIYLTNVSINNYKHVSTQPLGNIYLTTKEKCVIRIIMI